MSHFTFDFSGMEKSKRRKGADNFSSPPFEWQVLLFTGKRRI